MSSLPRGSRTGQATSSRTASRSRPSPTRSPSASCGARYPAWQREAGLAAGGRAAISEARRLATTLGHLPIAVEHAAAYLAETGQSVEEYLTRFTENAHQLLSEQPRLGSPGPGLGHLGDVDHAADPRRRAPVQPVLVLLARTDRRRALPAARGGIDDPPGLAEFLSSPQRFRAAATQLHRLSLARVDGARDLIQVHRVVQAVTQGRLRLHRIEAFRAYRAAADALLARSNPGNPDQAAATRSMTCLFSTWSPITGSCIRGIRRCARSSSTRSGDCTCAAAMSRR